MSITISIVTAYFVIKFIEYTFKVFVEDNPNTQKNVDKMLEDFKNRKVSN